MDSIREQVLSLRVVKPLGVPTVMVFPVMLVIVPSPSWRVEGFRQLKSSSKLNSRVLAMVTSSKILP